MANDETKGSGRVLTFVVTSALLAGPAAAVGCGSSERDYVNTPAPEPAPAPTATQEPALEPEPVAPDSEEDSEPTNVPPPETDTDTPPDSQPAPSTRPPSERTNNAPAPRQGARGEGVLEGL